MNRTLSLLFLLALLPVMGEAQILGERGGILQHLRDASREERPVAIPPGTTAIRNVEYGADPAQRFDLYLPARPQHAPVVFYVHGGGWANGDKTNSGVATKLDYWLAKGYAVISSNYRMIPTAMPLEQAGDIAKAVATAQRRAEEWQLDPGRFVLMGHSAGGHLVALLGADPRLLAEAGAQSVRGVVVLDSGALDVPALMNLPRVPKLYRDAFGADPAYWQSASPQQRLVPGATPMLLVCSSTRRVPMPPCDEARRFAQRADALDVATEVLPQALNHGQINHDLGQPSDYSARVSAWIDRLTRAD